MLHLLTRPQISYLMKLADEAERKGEQEEGGLHLTPAVAKEIGKQILIGSLGTALGAGAAWGVGRLNDHYRWTDSIPTKRLTQGVAAIGAALPLLIKLRHEMGMEKVREAYERERQQKRELSRSG